METLVKIFGAAVLVLVAVCAFALLAAVPVYFLWNWVGVAVLGLKVVTFWQALGITLLSSCLFKSGK